MINARFVTRVRAVALVCVLVALVLICKLYYLQVIHGAEYVRRADAQQIELKNPLLNRGTIYFTDKNGTEITAAVIKNNASSNFVCFIYN